LIENIAMRLAEFAERMRERAKVVIARERRQWLFSRTTKQNVIGSADRFQSGGLVPVGTTDSGDVKQWEMNEQI
jgi:hypothetical protein